MFLYIIIIKKLVNHGTVCDMCLNLSQITFGELFLYKPRVKCLIKWDSGVFTKFNQKVRSEKSWAGPDRTGSDLTFLHPCYGLPNISESTKCSTRVTSRKLVMCVIVQQNYMIPSRSTGVPTWSTVVFDDGWWHKTK